MANILVVDDSDVVRIEVSSALTGSGHNVLEAVNGLEGLKVASSSAAIDLVITDLNMPEMDGIKMVTEIRKLPARAAVPVFMLTTEASQELRAAGKAAGVMVWIVKPFKADKVLPAITKVLAMAVAS